MQTGRTRFKFKDQDCPGLPWRTILGVFFSPSRKQQLIVTSLGYCSAIASSNAPIAGGATGGEIRGEMEKKKRKKRQQTGSHDEARSSSPARPTESPDCLSMVRDGVERQRVSTKPSNLEPLDKVGSGSKRVLRLQVPTVQRFHKVSTSLGRRWYSAATYCAIQ